MSDLHVKDIFFRPEEASVEQIKNVIIVNDKIQSKQSNSCCKHINDHKLLRNWRDY